MALPLAIASTVFTVMGQQQEGAAAQASAKFEARQRDQAAGQERASSQREAAEHRRRSGLALSTLQARAGGGGLDTGVLDLASDIAGEGEYRALTSIYEGEEQARGLEMGADAARMRGRTARDAAGVKSVSTMLSSGSSLYEKYGNGGPKGSTASKYN
jgi:hypothetical protein